MAEYKGYLIFGKAVKVYPGSYWFSQGDVFSNDPAGSSILIKHLNGGIAESKEAAETDGQELCKKWVDKNLSSNGWKKWRQSKSPR
jgi:hypothetical protein